ncbi:MAG: hypothetical protein AAFU85_03660 [Planctomycetota bacterium]
MVILLAVVPLLGGCRGAAQRDAYRAKMANEIRVLEDQLYDADYQNRVLRDELRRARENCAPSESPEIDSYGPMPEVPTEPIEPPVILPSPDGESHDADAAGDDALGLDNPFDDDLETEPGVESPPSMEEVEDASERGIPSPLSDPPAMELPAPKIPGGAAEEIAPGIASPPDTSDVPTIVPGEQIPPGSGEPDPRQIDLPPTANILGERPSLAMKETEPVPTVDHIALHPNLSGGHQFDSDDEIDGLYVVVTVMDDSGKGLSLKQFDVDAEMSIVVLDPSIDGSSVRLGRWDFSPEEVREFIRSTPTDGLHVPIKWKRRRPTGKDVIVHVRMAAAEEEMRCQGVLKLEQSIAVSHWLPRG